MPRKALPIAAAFTALLPALARAAEAPALPAPAVSAGSMLQMALGLAIVLGMILVLAWIVRRLGLPGARPSGAIKVIAGAPVGQRERVVLVEIAGTWLVVGVAPGRVSALHTMPRADLQQAPSAAPGTAPFADWLKRVMEQRRAG
ncbi:MAG: flagellar biosynthetic protein FliO [Burkholderiales bacterium]|nr:flagellar biosynthetic protein FliO [Burkholderiales bacterium]MDP2399269.1 flagellar biosynthetic protein FliO [Burkholderiales bacterium]